MKWNLLVNRKFGPYLWLLPAALFLYVNQLKYWSDSELWPVTANRYFFEGKPEYFFGVKPLFHFILWLNTQLAELFNIHPIVTARLFSGINSLVILVLCDQILKVRNISVLYRVFFQVFLLSCSVWVFRSGEVRSDLYVTSMFLAAMLLFFRYKNDSKVLSVSIPSLIVISFMLSAKSAFWWTAGLPIFLPILITLVRIPQIRLALCLTGSVILALSLSQIEHSIQFLRNSFLHAQAGHSYFSIDRMEHVIRFCVQNPHAFIGILIVLALCIKNLKGRLELSFLSFLLLTIFYPDPLPFFWRPFYL